MDGSVFKRDRVLGGIFPGFVRSYRITLELSRDPNVITYSHPKGISATSGYNLSRMKSEL